MKHTLTAILIAGLTATLPPAYAQSASTSAPAAASASAAASSASSTATAPKKTTKKKTPAKKAATPAVVDEDVAEPSVTGSTVVEYQCEMGSKITVYTNAGDEQHIALKWGKRLHRLSRVTTETGANRFENHHYGLVWLDIPTKGILLDSKTGHQLANDCKDAEQRAQKASDTPAAQG
jgi:membrane-bound inhibitor of C-type lysozyme